MSDFLQSQRHIGEYMRLLRKKGLRAAEGFLSQLSETERLAIAPWVVQANERQCRHEFFAGTL